MINLLCGDNQFQEKGRDTLNVNFKYNDEEYKTQMIRKIGSH